MSELDSNMINLSEGDVIRVELNQAKMSAAGEDNIILGGKVPPPDKTRPSLTISLITDLDSETMDRAVGIEKSPFR